VKRPLVLGLMLAAAAALGIGVLVGGDGDEPSRDGPQPSRVPMGAPGNVDPRLPLPAGRIVGYVRDVTGRPVPGATVRLSDNRRRARTSRAGRFELRARPGMRTVIAAHPSYTRQSVATTLRREQGARVDFALAVTAPERVPVANSADRLIVWTTCEQLVQLSEDELRRWIRRGADGFVCQTGLLRGLGGDQVFTGKRGGRLHGPQYELQRRLRDSPAVRRAAEGKLLLYLAFYAVNHYNKRTPLADWFDDRSWSREVLPEVRNLAAAARTMGFTGVALDQELYPQEGGVETASWSWRHPGNRHSEAEVRRKVTERGRQLMQNMVHVFPGLELIAYNTEVPGNWQEKVHADVNEIPNMFAADVRVDLWDGLSSVQGYSAIRWVDAFFYKTFQLPGASWDTALEYNANRIYSFLSQRLSNWSYASSRLHVSPFIWVDEGAAEFEKARDPQYVREQLDAFKRWGAGGAFANYANEPLDGFDYSAYDDALRRASTPARVDRHAPTLALTSAPGTKHVVPAGKTIALKGVADDDFAIRAMRWYDDRGREGVARLTWEFTGDPRSEWNGEMRWSIENLKIARDAGHITISAEDIHGLARQLRLKVVR
jgi:hypothetical protein